MKTARLIRHTHKTGNGQKSLRIWHRRLGLASAVFLILLIISGVLLNHSHDLQLDTRPVRQSWLLNHYGIGAPQHVAQFNSATEPLQVADNMLWLGSLKLLEAQDNIVAAGYMGKLILAIDKQQLYVVNLQGQLLERQTNAMGLPADLNAMAIMEQRQVWLASGQGYFVSDDELITWRQAAPETALDWISPSAVTHTEQLVLLARSSHLNWQRVLQDLHSGRILGPWAIWFWDFIALILTAMLLMGVWIWWQRR
jgi:hypothetical protein